MDSKGIASYTQESPYSIPLPSIVWKVILSISCFVSIILCLLIAYTSALSISEYFYNGTFFYINWFAAIVGAFGILTEGIMIFKMFKKSLVPGFVIGMVLIFTFLSWILLSSGDDMWVARTGRPEEVTFEYT